jgi:hypothetical protein
VKKVPERSGGFVRPADDMYVTGRASLRWQRDYVLEAGCPVAALILDAVIADLDADGLLRTLIPERVRFGDLIGLRVMSAVHRLALERRAPRVAMHLPTLRGTPPTDLGEADFRAAVVQSLLEAPDVLERSLRQTPQTNEVGRSTLLRCALSRLGPTARVRLREIGCSAGLNLRTDQLPGEAALERGPLPSIVDRIGCDLDPVDPTTVEGRLHLTSYVWVDDVERFERLRHAFEVAAVVPVTVVRQEAAAFLEEVDLQQGTTTVLWHSAMWLYLSADSRRRVMAASDRLGSLATADRPFIHASWEWADGPLSREAPFELVMRTWDGARTDGSPFVLARGTGHGSAVMPVNEQVLDSEPLPV